MRAIVQDRYGSIDDLSLQEVPTPVPAEDEVLVQVRAASVHPDVWHVVTGQPAVLRLMGSGLRHPKVRVPGTDVAGVVVSVGDRVTRFQRGDEVFGETIRGVQWRNGGAFAEFATAAEDGLALMPSTISFEEAAAVPTVGLIALNNLPQRRKDRTTGQFGATGTWLGSIPHMLGLVARSAVAPELRGGSFAAPDKRSLMATLSQLLATGQLRVVIDRALPLEEASQALRYLASGQAVGRVVLAVSA